MTPWKLRALRFDLPAQEGSPDAVSDLIKFAEKWGFTSLVLHFEGVIRTKSLRNFSAENTYAPERVARVVDTARSSGLEVIPVIGTLGHAEHLVEGSELRPLLGHGTRYRHLFCPSNESIYEKLGDYILELTELFPDPHFHIGGDESWALGACPACRERLHRHETTEEISLTHLLHLTTILRQLNKRPWIWDDVLEPLSAEKLRRLPREVVICSWKTGSAVMPGSTNSSNRVRLYLDHGFEIVACPWTRSADHIAEATEALDGSGVLGGMITVWNLSTSFWPAFLPGAAFAGKLWAGGSREADLVLYETLRQLLPSIDQEALYGVCGVLSNPFWSLAPANQRRHGTSNLEENRNLYSFVLYEELLQRAVRSLPLGLERSILSEFHTQIQSQIRAAHKRGWRPSPLAISLPAKMDVPTGDDENLLIPTPETTIPSLIADTEGERARARKQERGVEEMIPSGRALLTVRLSLPVPDLEPTLHIEVEHHDKWREIYLGTFKPFNSFISVYNFQLPLNWKSETPTRLRFTVTDAGGDGILYAWLSLHQRTHRLRSLGPQAEPGSDTEAILIDPAGKTIHGFPNLLHRSQTSPEEDRCIIEMKVEAEME